MKDNTSIKVSDKHIILRIAAFVLALGIAAFSFAKAISNLGNTQEGWNIVKPLTDKESSLYAADFEFKYYYEGTNSEIRNKSKEISSLYSSSLLRMYKLLNAEEVFEGFVNVAAVNCNLGMELSIEKDLYDILFDAYTKTIENKGFNMFAGALYSEWGAIIGSSNPSDFDPDVYDVEAERIKAIVSVVNNHDNFSLEFLGDNKIIFNVSEEYKQFADEYEISSPIIDLGLLKNAYILDYISLALRESNLTDGYISSSDGLFLKMTDREVSYTAFGYQDDKQTLPEKKIEFKDAGLLSAFIAFPTEDNSFSSYLLSRENASDEPPAFRNYYFDITTGVQNNLIQSCYSYCGLQSGKTLSALSYNNIKLFNMSLPDDIKSEEETHSSDYDLIIYYNQK